VVALLAAQQGLWVRPTQLRQVPGTQVQPVRMALTTMQQEWTGTISSSLVVLQATGMVTATTMGTTMAPSHPRLPM
jgi:hypothetical protein